MDHIDFTRWKPTEPPTVEEIIRLWDQVSPESASRIRAGENVHMDMFCHHRIEIPDPLERDTDRTVMAVNVFWEDPGQGPEQVPLGACAFQVAYDDVFGENGLMVGTYVNKRALSLEEVLTAAHLISIAVHPTFTGIEWLPKETAEPTQQQ